jgi:hypothetical protein
MTACARESAQRVRPGCPHFGLHAGACGGCKMQHLHAAAQVASSSGCWKTTCGTWPRCGPSGCCGRSRARPGATADRARLSVRYVAKKGEVLVGFHERKSRYVADMRVCPVLPPQVSALLLPLRELIGAMDQRDRLPQIELAVGDERDRAGAAPPGAADGGRPGAPARLCGRNTACSGGCSPRARTRCTAGRRRAPAGLHAARVRHHDALQADRLHAGQPAHQPRAGGRARAPAGAAAWRARDRLVLRPGQLHAAAGHARAPGAGHRRQRGAGGSARATTRRSTAWRATPSRRATCSSSAPAICGLRPGRPLAGRPAARRRLRAGQGPGRLHGHRAAGSRRGASSTSAATRPRWRATPGCWCTRPATAARWRAWSTCSRTRPTWRAWRCSIAKATA